MRLHEPYKVLERTAQNCFIVMNGADGSVCLLKILKHYESEVFSYLKEHKDKHIPYIIDSYEEDEHLFVFEELIRGRTLRELMDLGELTDKEKTDYLCQLCDGLAFLHRASKPIIHRDLKPENIMISSDGILKIVDYDSAKIFKYGQERDTTLLGTHEYAAPEQYGFMQSDPRTDIYAVGKIIRELFPDSFRMKRISERACSLNPADRYPNAFILRKAITAGSSLWPPPGYRTRCWWHYMLASLYYSIFLIIIIFDSQGRVWMWWKHIVYRIEILFIFLLPVDVFFNWTGIFLDYPVPRLRRESRFWFLALGLLYLHVAYEVILLINYNIPYG